MIVPDLGDDEDGFFARLPNRKVLQTLLLNSEPGQARELLSYMSPKTLPRARSFRVVRKAQ